MCATPRPSEKDIVILNEYHRQVELLLSDKYIHLKAQREATRLSVDTHTVLLSRSRGHRLCERMRFVFGGGWDFSPRTRVLRETMRREREGRDDTDGAPLSLRSNVSCRNSVDSLFRPYTPLRVLDGDKRR